VPAVHRRIAQLKDIGRTIYGLDALPR
jgi:hypothetical protein